MKKILALFIAAAGAASATVTTEDIVALLTPTRAHITFDEATLHTDYIITALFRPDRMPKLKAQTSECLLGIERNISGSDTYGAVGFRADKMYFALCEPGTGLNPGADVSEAVGVSGASDVSLLGETADAVALTMFYTTDPDKADMVLVSSVKDGVFTDSYAAQAITLLDDKPAIGAAMHTNILYNGYVFGGSNWTLEDMFQVTHDVLTNTLPAPEPATASLGLLALAGVAARRKRCAA